MSLTARIAKAPICPECGKRCYSKQSQARAAARLMEQEQGLPFSTYRCGSVWHVGKTFKNRFCKSVPMTGEVAGVGIDPGRKGALALVSENDLVIYDFESIEAADQALTDLQDRYDIRFAVLERVWIRQKERNVTAVNVLIRSAAMWDALLHVHGIAHDEYSPQTWRKGLISGKKAGSKDSMVKKAIQIFGGDGSDFSRHDRAEAALMAYRAYRHIKAGWKTERRAG